MKRRGNMDRGFVKLIREIERGVFTPLVFSTSGGMSKECTIFYQRLAALTADKTDQSYATLLGWIRVRLSFALLRMAILCIRGTRSLRNFIQTIHLVALASAEADAPHLLCILLSETRLSIHSFHYCNIQFDNNYLLCHC